MSLLQLETSMELDQNLLGGKAASLIRLAQLGIPAPPAFVLTTDECTRYYEAGRRVPADVLAALPSAMSHLEAATGRTFGRGDRPLLVSVRSGAPVSMPGMMDTILNLGMTDEVEQALAELTGSSTYAHDTRRRFHEQYRRVVGRPSALDPWRQLGNAIAAVFDSWQSHRAVAYRENRGLTEVRGTAVVVQAMVFGNLDARSGTGVLFTRDPLTGAPEPLGEWLPQGQGEDVVSGTTDPLPLTALADVMPDVHRQLLEAGSKLESAVRDVQDIEFTVESGKLWLLQARVAKLSAEAAVRLAVQLTHEGALTSDEALDRVSAEQVSAMVRPHVDPAARADAEVIARGHSVCPGVASGTIVTDTDEAERRSLDGEDILLARRTTNPNDVHAMTVVRGILTEVGGATSHAAVVSRELNVPCVVGCGQGTLTGVDGRVATLDATAGELLAGILPVGQAKEADDSDLATLAQWARAEAQDSADTSLVSLLRARRRSARGTT